MTTGLRTAVGFLTRLPVRSSGGADLARAAGYFPVVGLLVAGAGIGTWAAAEPLLGPLAAAVLAVLATVAITGALHEDGLADLADGFWGATSPSRRLEIMKDSRVGTFGVIAIAGDLALRAAMLVPLDLAGAARVLIAGHVIGRAAPLVLTRWLPPARADGLGAGLGRPAARAGVLAGVTVVAAAIATAGVWAWLPLSAGAVAVAAVGWGARRRIGGFTGDVLGAAVLLVNLAVVAAIVALIRAGWI